MGNNKFCTSCKYFEKSPDNCGRKNGKYGLCKYGVRQGFCPRVVNYQHPICESIQGQDRNCKMQHCYNTLLVLQTRSAKERQADR